ncbi:DNA-dependent ATPase protein rad54 [Linnemannia exigua]|uniref:DNA-dependent ATPase protein rad54 n=1 Tax=Linnemannia exigua TaxID=604196 RepID=A0AAD4D3D5_9FUNG|nr:DNA-dependent ATPase protein rad54 [Linnemannia exigua]
MKRTSSGLSLKRPTAIPAASQDGQDDITNSQSIANNNNSKSSQHSSQSSESGATKIRNAVFDHIVVEIPCVQATAAPMPKTILKKFPGVKSPNQKKVEFVEDSEGSLSDPDYDDDFDRDKENRNNNAVPEISLKSSLPTPASKPAPPGSPLIKSSPPTSASKPAPLPAPLVTKPPPIESTSPPLTPPDAPSTKAKVVKTKPLLTLTTTKPMPKAAPKPIAPPVPKKVQAEAGPDEDEDEDMYDGDAGDDSSGSDYSSDGNGRKRVKTGRTTHAMIKASLPQATDRATRSGRAPLSAINITISSKPLPSTKPIHPSSKSLATLGRRFKIPSFTDPSKAPVKSGTSGLTLGTKRRPPIEAKSAHDYTMEGSIILYDPAWALLDEAQREEERLLKASQESATPIDADTVQQVIIPKKEKAKSKSIAEMLGIIKPKEQPKVHVVVDPVLGRVLRPHQVEGVKFMYKCTTGMTMPNAFGCIMADEMGLGKTLQCITLLWTLLKQSPDFGKGTIEKCIICCPSSLVKNWANEIIKWLGPGKIGVLTCDAKGTKEDTNNAMRQWASARLRMVVNPVLIISYESLRMYAPILAQTPIGLMLCDEGHRLKNSVSQTFIALNELNVQRRVILSGTPIQNDLSEYFSLLNFANPGLLGSTAEFRKNYELPILRGRDSEATDKEQELSNQKLTELSGVVSKFIIRRTNDILSKYLPTKFEHVVFCQLSTFQLSLYKHFINSKSIQRLLRGQGSQPLKAIGLLKKLCNHPDLLDLPDDLEGCDSLLPQDYQTKNSKKPLSRGGILVQPEFSGKMLVLARMLAKIKKDTNDKIVLISNYTQTLDIFEKLCRQNQYGVLRLDGTMTINKRQKLVDRFNNPDGNEFVFLLSSKAGGCGLNLIGANRLVLFDPDWNPASDQQALARVWRDGQKKDCFVYRFIATGSIEEKIFQRQSHKQSLSSCVVDEDQDVERHFSQENLRQLFQFNETTECCDTHETFKCKRCVDGRQMVKAPQVSYGDTSTWNHYKGDHDLLKLSDPLLQEEAESNAISFVFQYISH